MAEITDVSEELLQVINALFQKYAADPGLYPSDWKHIIMRLQRIANRDPLSPFDVNAKTRFNYLEICVMCRVCDKCGDTELSRFCHSCFFNEDDEE